jgi:hypothetical protein|tara:strand:+ start:4236 stop:4640 length:405 start_codon:yes stop_codon:yes gene_type:complete
MERVEQGYFTVNNRPPLHFRQECAEEKRNDDDRGWDEDEHEAQKRAELTCDFPIRIAFVGGRLRGRIRGGRGVRLASEKGVCGDSLCAESCEEYGQLRLVNVQERETFRLAPLKGRLLVRVFARARTPSPPHPR